MSELVKTKYHDSEVTKTTDFGHTADTLVELANALIDGANQDVENSFVFSGMEVVQTDPASMNVKIKAGLAFDRFSSKILHLDADLVVPVSAASPVQERIDTIEIRYKETDFNNETRAFKDPANGTVMYTSVPTRTLVSIEARCLAGDLGANAAPLTEFGWIKLAEILVQAAAGAIYTADIRGITAERDTVENSAWTVEKALTFRQGSINTLKVDLYTHKTNNITGANTVHGIRQGHTNGFDADTLDGAHTANAATANTVMLRDANGRSKAAAPAASDDVARKAETDAETAARIAHIDTQTAGIHGSTVAATANKLVHRDANGRAQIASPSDDADIANKGWVRDFIYPVGSTYVQYPDAASNDDATEFPVAQRPATLFGGTWTEQWSDEAVFFRTRGVNSDSGRANGFQADQMQQITGYISRGSDRTLFVSFGGAFSARGASVDGGINGSTATTGYTGADFDSANSPGARTGTTTYPENRRIKVWKRTA